METLALLLQLFVDFKEALYAVVNRRFSNSFFASSLLNNRSDRLLVELEPRNGALALRALHLNLRALFPVNFGITQHDISSAAERALHFLTQAKGSMVQQVLVLESLAAVGAREHLISHSDFRTSGDLADGELLIPTPGASDLLGSHLLSTQPAVNLVTVRLRAPHWIVSCASANLADEQVLHLTVVVVHF